MESRTASTGLAVLVGLGTGFALGQWRSNSTPAEESRGRPSETVTALVRTERATNEVAHAELLEWIAREEAGGPADVEIENAGQRAERDLEFARVAHDDPMAALEMLKREMEEDVREEFAGKVEESELEVLVREHLEKHFSDRVYDDLFRTLCRADVAGAVAFATESEIWKHGPPKYLFQYVPIDGHPAVVEELTQLDDGEFKLAQLPYALEWWNRTDPEQAKAWAEANLNPRVAEHADIVLQMAEGDEALPAGVETLIANCHPDRRGTFLTARAEALANYPSELIPERADRLLALGTVEDQHAIVGELAHDWGEVAPRAAAEWAFGIEDPSVRAAALSDATRNWFEALPTEADAWFAQLPADRADELRSALAAEDAP
jgi:hypothetical protein